MHLVLKVVDQAFPHVTSLHQSQKTFRLLWSGPVFLSPSCPVMVTFTFLFLSRPRTKFHHTNFIATSGPSHLLFPLPGSTVLLLLPIWLLLTIELSVTFSEGPFRPPHLKITPTAPHCLLLSLIAPATTWKFFVYIFIAGVPHHCHVSPESGFWLFCVLLCPRTFLAYDRDSIFAGINDWKLLGDKQPWHN